MIDFKIFKWMVIVSVLSVATVSFNAKKNKEKIASSTVKITFKNSVGSSGVVLNDSIYSNPFSEKYTIAKLRYYVTNVSLSGVENIYRENNSYHLIDESKIESQSFTLSIPAGNYNVLQFLLGVDSLHNVSGAQTDDLDPTKDMFWTWNSGYVMVKMEGNSPSSKLVNNKYEFHIGGFSGPFNVVKSIKLNMRNNTDVNFRAGKTTEIFINADINTGGKAIMK